MTPEPPIDFDFEEGKQTASAPDDGADAADEGGIAPTSAPVRSLPPLVGHAIPHGEGQVATRPRPKSAASDAPARPSMLLRGVCAAVAAAILSALIVLGLRAADRAIHGSAAGPRSDAVAARADAAGTLRE